MMAALVMWVKLTFETGQTGRSEGTLGGFEIACASKLFRRLAQLALATWADEVGKRHRSAAELIAAREPAV